MAELSQSGFLHALGLSVLNSLWQMTLLWVIFQFLSGFIISKNHSLKNLLATLLLLAGFGWFVFTFFAILSDSAHKITIIQNALSSLAGNEKLNNWFQLLLSAAAITYVALLGIPLYRFWKSYRYLIFIRNEGLKKINVEWRMFSKKLSAIMGIRKPVSIWLSEYVASPVTIGFLKPVILVPIEAISKLTTRQLEALLLHELSHIRRHDYLINLLINVINTILYFNPFVKLFVRAIESEREKSCDEMVIQFQYDPHGYATALLQLEKANYFATPLTLAASGKKNDLLHRIEMILGFNKKPAFSFNKLAGLFAGLVFAIGFNSILFFNKPGNKFLPTVSLTNISSPFFSITDELMPMDEDRVSNMGKAFPPSMEKENTLNTSLNVKKLKIEKVEKINLKPLYKALLNVNFVSPIPIPVLKQYQEMQVKKATDVSKRILEEVQWKAVEKNTADAFSNNEKDNIKQMYLDAFDNYDWQTLENMIRRSYYEIDWDKTNEKLDNAIYKIKLDSLQNIYTKITINLESLIESMHENKQAGIPDTDITIDNLVERNLQVQKLLNKIKGLKTRKIIHL